MVFIVVLFVWRREKSLGVRRSLSFFLIAMNAAGLFLSL